MKRLIAFSLLTLISFGVSAADIPLSWDADPRATEYRVEQSVDEGATWVLVVTSPTLPITVTGVPDSGLVLLRACASGATSDVCRDEVGFFYNGDWLPLSAPTNMSTP